MGVKKILIVGINSYIGTNFEKYANSKYEIYKVNSRNNEWKNKDFSKYDVVLHVAGIAHVSSKRKLEKLYYEINKDLPIEVAKKARKEGVKQFIFMSSMIIYGADGKIGKERQIDSNTSKQPIDFYGDSKLQADLYLQQMQTEEFGVAVLRIPMVYGPNCRGNFQKLKKIAKISPIFPSIENKRSMIYIENLCEFLINLIDNEQSGVFYPQNKEYVSTKDIIKQMAKCVNKKIYFTNIFNPILKILSMRINYINKVFGNKTYSKEISGDFSYCIVDFEESIKRCM